MRTRSPRWWLETEVACPFCLQEHAVELTWYCVRCDRPVCPICAVELTLHRTAVCPECHEEAP